MMPGRLVRPGSFPSIHSQQTIDNSSIMSDDQATPPTRKLADEAAPPACVAVLGYDTDVLVRPVASGYGAAMRVLRKENPPPAGQQLLHLPFRRHQFQGRTARR